MIFFIAMRQPRPALVSGISVMHLPLSVRISIAALLCGAAGLAPAADLTVSAAASLTNAFTDVAQGYDATHPGEHVAVNFAASGALLAQMQQGAPVDVFASADEQTMDKAQNLKLIDPATRTDFASNTLVLIVPSSSKLQPTQLKDLLQPAYRRVAIGNVATVPVGRYTKDALDLAGFGAQLEPKLIPAESVRQVLAYVERGEVDAGFVYATDAAIAGDKVRIVAKLATRQPIRYPIASLAASPKAGSAKSFIEYVQSPAGQAILQKYGFSAP